MTVVPTDDSLTSTPQSAYSPDLTSETSCYRFPPNGLEFNPFGQTFSQSGTYADANPWRFSTKQMEPAWNLYYYGFRFYSPEVGRWLSRDPLHARLMPTLYLAFRNNAFAVVDPDGREDVRLTLPPNNKEITINCTVPEPTSEEVADWTTRLKWKKGSGCETKYFTALQSRQKGACDAAVAVAKQDPRVVDLWKYFETHSGKCPPPSVDCYCCEGPCSFRHMWTGGEGPTIRVCGQKADYFKDPTVTAQRLYHEGWHYKQICHGKWPKQKGWTCGEWLRVEAEAYLAAQQCTEMEGCLVMAAESACSGNYCNKDTLSAAIPEFVAWWNSPGDRLGGYPE